MIETIINSLFASKFGLFTLNVFIEFIGQTI